MAVRYDPRPMGTLYLVATPIGNLEDVTLRAIRVLREAAHVYAEDTRRTRRLLDRHDIAARPRSLHAHNEVARFDEVLAALDAGEDVALVSDAGTPLVSDPGERLVACVAEAGHTVSPVPGASAVTSALVASGLPVVPYTFVGFLSRKAGERAALLSSLSDREETLVFFESPKRLAGTLREMVTLFGDRAACVARELTKIHEELARGTLSELADRYAEEPKGEITIVVAGAPAGEVDPAQLRGRVSDAVTAGRSARDIAADLHVETGVPRRVLYALVLEVQREREGA